MAEEEDKDVRFLRLLSGALALTIASALIFSAASWLVGRIV